MKVARNRQDLERFCAEFFGQKPELVVEEVGAGEGLSLARSRELEDQRAQEVLQEQALAHPIVQEAIRVFGAEVDGVQPPRRREP
jgi:hypothetical protein